MIVRDKPGLLELLFAMRGSVLPHILPQLVVVASFASAILLWDRHMTPLPHMNATPFTVFGVALSLFLGFRNNAAYDRWWEARRLWGGLLADTRSLAREAELFMGATPSRQDLLRLMRRFLHLHRCALRGLPSDQPPPGPDTPDATLDAMARLLAAERQAQRLDGFGARALANRLSAIALAQAGCERIRATPLPFVYSLLVFRTSWLYCFLLPLALVDQAGWLTPAFTVIVAYTFFGLAEVTEELAHPFGPTANTLPLDAICRAAEISLAPHLDEPAPPPLAPVNFRLD